MAFTDSAPANVTAGMPAPATDVIAEPDASVPALSQQDRQLLEWAEAPNIAEMLDESDLNEIGSKVKFEFDIDERSRTDWVDKTKLAMDLAMQVTKPKTYPWPRASNVIYPLLTTASMQFAARSYPAIVNGRNVVKGVVIGDDNGTPATGPDGQPIVGQDGNPIWLVQPGEKRMRAERIGEHMSWQLLDEMEEWENDTDTLLHTLPITGCVFRKTYFDPTKGRNVSTSVSPLNVSISYYAKGLELAPRITEMVRFYPLEISEMERAGLFLEIQYSPEPDANNDPDAPREFLEQHRWLDLDDDGFPEPYIVTVHRQTAKVVRIVARYDPESILFDERTNRVVKIKPVHYYTKYDFLPNPEGGIYGLGFGQLLRPINEAVNTTFNLIFDSGHLANTGGGFVGKGMNIHAGAIRFMPGEFKPVNVSGGTIKDNIVPMQFPGPSSVLFQMLGLLIDAGKDIAAVKDVLMGEQNKHNVPASTTMALIEQGLKVFTGIYKRIHRSLEKELDKLVRLNRIYLPENTVFQIGDTWRSIQREDYENTSGVEPISDPEMVSDTQRMAQAQFLQQFMQDPMFNGLEIRRRMLSAGGIPQIENLLVQQPPPNPQLLVEQGKLENENKKLEIDARKVAVDEAMLQSEQMKNMAQALLFFTQADALVGNQNIAWAEQQLAAWQAQFEAANATAQGIKGAEGAMKALPNDMQVPTPDAPAPGITATPGVPQGMPPGMMNG